MVAQISESSPVVGLVFVVCYNGLFLITCIWGWGWAYEYSVEEALDPLELKLQLVVSPPAWVLGTEFRSFEAVCTHLSSPLAGFLVSIHA